jgi:hypothetical protein
MLKQARVGFALGCSVILLGGCTRPATPEPAPTQPTEASAAKADAPQPAGSRRVTVHVPDMTEKLHLT